MSGDEKMVLIGSLVVTAGFWLDWYRAAFINTLVVKKANRLLYVAAPVICVILLYIVLRNYAADDVRESTIYLPFYMVVGAAWVGLVRLVFPFLGISPRDDAIERQNLSAALATFGALLGTTFCFAGANVGNGPGWWVVIFSAGLSTAAFFALWALLEKYTAISETVTINRESGAGLRLGGLLCGMGLIFGRAAAGDWVSTEATVKDFVTVGWVAVPLVVIAVIIEKLMPRNSDDSASGSIIGLFLGGLYIIAPIFYVFVWQEKP
jgi:uncharacterized membrane protein YjfL (UPF0719 family)